MSTVVAFAAIGAVFVMRNLTKRSAIVKKIGAFRGQLRKR